jgi:CARDB
MKTRRRACILLFLVAGLVPGLARQAQAAPNHKYAAKIVCGIQGEPKSLRLTRGLYATTVNIHNPNARTATLFKRLALTFPPAEERPGAIQRIARESLTADQALKVDCDEIRILLKGQFTSGFVEGFVIVDSDMPLDVTGVYTSASIDRAGTILQSGIDVNQVSESQVLPVRGGPQGLGGAGFLPDLVVSSFCVNNTDINAVVLNQGNASAGPSVLLVKFAKADGTVEKRRLDVPALAAGVFKDISTSIPAACFQPDCFYAVTVDVDGDVLESDETNNSELPISVCVG